MKTKLNQMNVFIGALLIILAIISGNSSANNLYLFTDKVLACDIVAFSVPVIYGSTTSDDLEKAKKEKKVVFLIITGKGAFNVHKAVTMAKEASAKVKNATVIQLNKDDASNSALVSKFRIQTVPIPFILIISAKGLPVAGVEPSKATSDDLVKAIPSPCQDAVFVGLNEKKPVFLIVSKKGYKDKISVVSTTKSAILKIASKPEIVEIDFDDKKEAEFLKQVGVTSMNGLTVTVIINATGQITDKLIGIQSIDRLISLANKPPAKGGCCPGGSGKPGCK